MPVAAVALDTSWLTRVADVVHILLALALLAIFVVAVPALWSLRRSYAKVSRLVERVSTDLAPLTVRAGRIAENVEYVSTSIRTDLERVTALVARTERRIDATLARAEARARDLEALLTVAQAQAEESLVAAASTVAGVREGFAALRDDLAGVSRRDPVGRMHQDDDHSAIELDDDLDHERPDAVEHTDPGARRRDLAPQPRIRHRDA